MENLSLHHVNIDKCYYYHIIIRKTMCIYIFIILKVYYFEVKLVSKN